MKNNDKAREQEKERNREHYRELNREYYNYKKAKMAQPVEERAKNMHVPELVWYGATGTTDIPKDMQEKIAERQLAFFKENEGVMYANPICYKDLVPTPRGKLGEHSAEIALRRSSLALAHSLVSSDRFTKL